MIVQAFEYEKGKLHKTDRNIMCIHLNTKVNQATDIHLTEFFESTRGKFQHKEIKALVEDLYKERESRLGLSV